VDTNILEEHAASIYNSSVKKATCSSEMLVLNDHIAQCDNPQDSKKNLHNLKHLSKEKQRKQLLSEI
jgi:hypothetical protein